MEGDRVWLSVAAATSALRADGNLKGQRGVKDPYPHDNSPGQRQKRQHLQGLFSHVPEGLGQKS